VLSGGIFSLSSLDPLLRFCFFHSHTLLCFPFRFSSSLPLVSQGGLFSFGCLNAAPVMTATSFFRPLVLDVSLFFVSWFDFRMFFSKLLSVHPCYLAFWGIFVEVLLFWEFSLCALISSLPSFFRIVSDFLFLLAFSLTNTPGGSFLDFFSYGSLPLPLFRSQLPCVR